MKNLLFGMFGRRAIKAAEKTIAELRAQLQERADRIAELDGLIKTLRITVTKQHDRIAALNADVETKEREITRLLNEAQLP